MSMKPFRVKVHEENVPYSVRRIKVGLLWADFTVLHGKIIKHNYSEYIDYQGRVHMSEEDAVMPNMAKGLRRAALKNGKDVITLLDQRGDVIEYLDEPGLEGEKILTPHCVNPEKTFFGNKKGDAVRRGNIWYVEVR